jgi:hypothetical protein
MGKLIKSYPQIDGFQAIQTRFEHQYQGLTGMRSVDQGFWGEQFEEMTKVRLFGGCKWDSRKGNQQMTVSDGEAIWGANWSIRKLRKVSSFVFLPSPHDIKSLHDKKCAHTARRSKAFKEVS